VEGFVDKGDPLSSLNNAVEMVLSGKLFYSRTFEAVRLELRVQSESYQKILSAREIEVLIQVAEGRDDKDIAGRLSVSPNTISTHRRNIRVKLNAHNDRDLVNYARKAGLVPLTCGE
jgi:DNA-binding NarL/FixJ family response regulator